MLQNIRDNSQSTIAKVIVGLIVVTFALFGVESIVGSFTGESDVAIVNGEEISQLEFQKAVDFKRRQLINQMGASFDPSLIDDARLQKTVRDELVKEKILLLDAENKSMSISDAAIDRQIIGMPQFQTDNKFDNDRFLSFLRNFGMTTQEFKQWLKKQYILAQQKNAFIGSGFVLQSELNNILSIDRQTRDFAYTTINLQDLKTDIEVSNSDLKTYFDANQSDYKFEESVDIEYILVDKATLADSQEVSDEEIAAKYEEKKKAYVAEEERDSSHILLELNDDRTEEQAIALLKELKEKVLAGESFAELAKEHSDDIGSKIEGGKLGFAKKGLFDPDFEKTLFSMKEGDVSDPVESQFGYHIIQLHEIEKKQYSPLEEVRESIANEIKGDKADSAYIDITEQLADISYSSSDLKEPSDVLSLSIKSTTLPVSGGDGIWSDRRVIDAAFSDDVKNDGNNSSLIEVEKGKSVVLRVVEHRPERLYTFEEAEASVRQHVVDAKAVELAKSKGQAIIKGEEVLDDSKWTEMSSVSRNSSELPRDVIKRVFELKKPEASPVLSGVNTEDGDFYIIKLTAVSTASADAMGEAQKSQALSVISSQIGSDEFSDLEAYLQNSAEVEYN